MPQLHAQLIAHFSEGVGGLDMGESGSGMGAGIGGTGSDMGGSMGGGGMGGSGSSIGWAIGGSPGWAIGGTLFVHAMSPTPPSVTINAPIAGRTSAGPDGGAVGRTVLREPTAYFGGPRGSLSTTIAPQPLGLSKIRGGRGWPSK